MGGDFAVGGEFPCMGGGMGNFAGGNFLLGGGNRRSDFDHSNLFLKVNNIL